MKKPALGRGLGSLLSQPSATPTSPAATEPAHTPAEHRELRRLPIEWLQPGRYQPRKTLDPEALQELADSIKAQGLIQPIVVRQLAERQFEIVAGERRWRASQLAGLHEIPCLVKTLAEQSAMAIALIENIQREELTALEQALAFQRLLTEFGLQHQELAQAIGKSRSAISNSLRLLNLQDEVKLLLEHGDIEMGHARALLGLEQDAQTDAARQVVAQALTVRDTEKLVKDWDKPKADKPKPAPDANIQALSQNLSQRLGAKVDIQHKAQGKGKLVIAYNSLDELDGILTRIQ